MLVLQSEVHAILSPVGAAILPFHCALFSRGEPGARLAAGNRRRDAASTLAGPRAVGDLALPVIHKKVILPP
jgi:hypothetical protein